MAGKKKGKGIHIFGWTISISTLSLIILYFWLKSIDYLFSDWLADNKLLIFIITTIFIIFLVVLGYIKISTLSKKGKSIF